MGKVLITLSPTRVEFVDPEECFNSGSQQPTSWPGASAGKLNPDVGFFEKETRYKVGKKSLMILPVMA